MKTFIIAVALMLSGAAQAKHVVPEVFTLGRELCLSTARAQLLDACDYHAELKTRTANKQEMTIEICETYGEDNPAREAACYARAALLSKDEGVQLQAKRCQDYSSATEKKTCLKKVFTAKSAKPALDVAIN